MKIIKVAKERNTDDGGVCDAVAAIIRDVRLNGDAAALYYSKQFDGSERAVFRVARQEIEAARASVSAPELAAMRQAAENINAFARAQRATIIDLTDFQAATTGLLMGHTNIPVDSALCYVPGGAYPLFSTALMLVTPAKAAGVRRIAAYSPVERGANGINAKTLAALDLAGADEIYAIGGVQAIAAFAYGTEQIKPVDLIVGPGNRYVAEAKRQCYGKVGIDFVAGPSEVLIIADSTANVRFVVADLLAQCEHDTQAQGILITTDEDFAGKVLFELENQLETLPTAPVARQSWQDFGEILVVDSLETAAALANERAPEHLELQCRNADQLAKSLRNYGSLFMGRWSAEVFGDYISGTNHTLPTARAARYSGGLWVGTFLKTLTWQKSSRVAALALSCGAQTLAAGEGLAANARAAALRQEAAAPSGFSSKLDPQFIGKYYYNR